ncbi:MAG: ABC transporter substrate-binding protein, partial [Chloroflexota bacterium]|nr:ABC transporter substrate-binding protein [Chloroflexota bacterium]
MLFVLSLLVACGAAAPEERAAPAAEPAPAQEQAMAEAEPAPTAAPAAADTSMEQEMAKPTVVRYVESQGEIQVETNQHCGGNRPIISQFLPYVEFLVEADPVTAEFNPWLAESWETTADAKTWTFKLRQGVEFHHGYGEMTAQDFVDMAVAKSNTDCQSSTTSFWKEMAQAEAVDDYTVKYTMNNASLPMISVVSNLPTGLELFSLSKKQVDEVGYDNLD